MRNFLLAIICKRAVIPQSGHQPVSSRILQSANTVRKEHEAISETASFVQHYSDEGELAAWFSLLETVLYEEVMKYDDSPERPHYHGLARLIGRKDATVEPP